MAVSAVVAGVAIVGCGARSGGTPGTNSGRTEPAAAAPSSPAAQAPAQPSQPPLGAGQVGTLAQVPWGEVEPGWALAEYTTGSNQVAAPVTLYMVDPEGGLYRLYRWPATTEPWQLVAWSGDKSRVLLQQVGANQLVLHQLTIATGQITTFTLPATVTAVLGYTRPDGENILVDQDGVVRYNLTGVLQARLSDGPDHASAVSSPDGLTEVVSGATGLELVSNSGSMVRLLPIPGTDAPAGGCTPVRWWNGADVLVSCMPDTGSSTVSGPRLWLVPVTGGTPTALTPQRSPYGPDFGDIDAWQLPAGLYLQAEAGCGPPYIAKQAAGGALQPVVLPGSAGNVVIATSGDRMLVQEYSECTPGSSLGWLNPATGARQQVLIAQAKDTGVVSAVPFDADGQQPPPGV